MSYSTIKEIIKKEVELFAKTLMIEKPKAISVKSFANIGDVAEGILGAALAARFLDPEGTITTDNVFQVLQDLNQNKNISKSATVLKRKAFTRLGNPEIKGSKSDKIILTIGLSTNNFKGLVDYGFFQNISSIVNGAIKFASSPWVMDHVMKVWNDPNENVVEISSIGTENQRGTKVDLRIVIDNSQIQWGALSLKAGGTKQLGQIGKGWAGDPKAKKFTRGIFDLFKGLFGIEINKQLAGPYLKALESGSKTNIINAIDDIYYNAYKKIAARFTGDEDELADFLSTFARGVRHEALLEEEGVILVHLGTNDFKALDFNKLFEIIEGHDIDVSIEYQPPVSSDTVPYLHVYMRVDGKDFGKLISVRPKIRIDEKGRLKEFRHYVEKEIGLAKLINIAS